MFDMFALLKRLGIRLTGQHHVVGQAYSLMVPQVLAVQLKKHRKPGCKPNLRQSPPTLAASAVTLAFSTFLAILGLIAVVPYVHAAEPQQKHLFEKQVLISYSVKAIDGRRLIPADRRVLLSNAASGIRKALGDHGTVDLVFVCTHNSRRSQLAQVWAAIAASHYQLDRVRSHSCGTETTACNTRTVAALERAGLKISHSGDEQNPFYSMVYAAELPPIVLFSKAFEHVSLPKDHFIAMMCCDHADQNCPNIPSAIQRVPLSYVDPKISDDRDDEAEVYDERCLQIATEMFEMMKLVAQNRD